MQLPAKPTMKDIRHYADMHGVGVKAAHRACLTQWRIATVVALRANRPLGTDGFPQLFDRFVLLYETSIALLESMDTPNV